MRRCLHERFDYAGEKTITKRPFTKFSITRALQARKRPPESRGVDFQKLTLLLKDFHVAAPVIATPREIVAEVLRLTREPAIAIQRGEKWRAD